MLVDTFGDGWNTAKFQIVNEEGYHAAYSPTAADDFKKSIRYCFDHATVQNGETIITGVYGFAAKHSWEVCRFNIVLAFCFIEYHSGILDCDRSFRNNLHRNNYDIHDIPVPF